MKELTRLAQNLRATTTTIAINNLGFNYGQDRAVLTDVNLDVCTGEKVGLIGANGAGKTTLFMTVCGVLTPNYGEVKILDKTVVPGEFNPDIGLVFQNPDDQLFCPTVRDDVAFGAENMGLSPEEVAERVEIALSLTGVSHLIDRVPHHLSGGEKCMVAIASVLAMLPQVILYDEPTTGLDPITANEIIQLMLKIQRDLDTASIIITHDMDCARVISNRMIILQDGINYAEGTYQELSNSKDPKVKAFFKEVQSR